MDQELIESLRNYANAYISNNQYDFNPGIALLVADRMESLIVDMHKKFELETNLNIGDRVWIPDGYIDGDYVILNKNGYCIINIEAFINEYNKIC